MDRSSVARDVALRLVAAERAMDAALAAHADLLTRLIGARREAEVSTQVGAAAVAHAAAAVADLAAARSETVACHRALARVQADLAIPAVDVGQGDKDPPGHGHRPPKAAAAGRAQGADVAGIASPWQAGGGGAMASR